MPVPHSPIRMFDVPDTVSPEMIEVPCSPSPFAVKEIVFSAINWPPLIEMPEANLMPPNEMSTAPPPVAQESALPIRVEDEPSIE